MSIESMNDHIVKGLNSAIEAVSPPTSKQKTPQKLSSETLDLIEQRRKLLADKDFDKSEMSRLQREIRRNIRRNLKHHDEIIIENAIERNSSRKSMKIQLNTGRKHIFKLLN